jgi:hypothetical protein
MKRASKVFYMSKDILKLRANFLTSSLRLNNSLDAYVVMGYSAPDTASLGVR